MAQEESFGKDFVALSNKVTLKEDKGESEQQLVQLDQVSEIKSGSKAGQKEQASSKSKHAAKRGKKSFRKNPLIEHVPSDETDLEISAINS